MPRESHNVRVLRGKALASLRSAVTAFNGLEEDGRVTTVLLSVQHAFEMLLKAILEERKRSVFDKRSRKAISLEKAIRLCQQEPDLKLDDEAAGTIRWLDALRDAEQHWYVVVDEGLLYLNIRAGITVFDDLLERAFGERLADHLPLRVLPISADPPETLDLLVDREYERIARLLEPGRRATAEAKARIRTLLATEALADPDAAEISEADVRRVARGVREGKPRDQVFPKLSGITSSINGSGVTVEVRVVKKGGMPVTYTDDPAADVSAIRMVDLEKKFHMGPLDLAKKVGLSPVKSAALRRHLGLDEDDDSFSHRFVFGGTALMRYSDNALRAMQDAVAVVDVDGIWESHRTVPYNRQDQTLPPCTQPGCVGETRAASQ